MYSAQVMLGIEKDEQLDFSTLVDIISASAKIGESLRQKRDGMADGIITKIVANVHTSQVRITTKTALLFMSLLLQWPTAHDGPMNCVPMIILQIDDMQIHMVPIKFLNLLH